MMNRFFTLLLAASCLTAVGQDFDGLTQAFTTDSSIFLTSEGQLSWDNAQAFAASVGGHLATFANSVENQEIVPWMTQNSGYWFGLRQDVNGAEPDEGWGWVTGESLDFTNWNGPEPNNVGNEDCGELTANGTWNDNACAELRYFVVEVASHAGCTDQQACNFDVNANLDDGSCHFNCQFCHDGTVWDEDLFKCVVANPSDSNFDGCVQLNDLLDLLSAYGTCSFWQCGDPLEYQGYDYATVQIGEQCWFAENLRTEKYSNGQSIFNGVESAEWWSSEAYEGAYCLYGQGNSPCEFYGDEDVCMDSSDSIFLYNWYAVDNPSSLCPSGWSVPSDSGWMELETFLGMAEEELSTIGFRGGELGHVLKSSTLWLDPNTGEIQGEDVIGFNAVPAGQRSTEGAFSVYGHDAQFWTSTPNPISEDGICRSLHSNAQGINRRDSFSLKWMGKSVRCIKDAE